MKTAKLHIQWAGEFEQKYHLTLPRAAIWHMDFLWSFSGNCKVQPRLRIMVLRVCSYRLFFFNIYLPIWEVQRQRKLLCKCPLITGPGPRLKLGARNPIQASFIVAETQLLPLSLLPPRVCVSGKLESRTESRAWYQYHLMRSAGILTTTPPNTNFEIYYYLYRILLMLNSGKCVWQDPSQKSIGSVPTF